MIKITVTKGENTSVFTFKKDRDANNFCQQIHSEKMDIATKELFGKRFTQGLITRRDTSMPNGMGYSEKPQYDKLRRWIEQNSQPLKIQITHGTKYV